MLYSNNASELHSAHKFIFKKIKNRAKDFGKSVFKSFKKQAKQIKKAEKNVFETAIGVLLPQVPDQNDSCK